MEPTLRRWARSSPRPPGRVRRVPEERRIALAPEPSAAAESALSTEATLSTGKATFPAAKSASTHLLELLLALVAGLARNAVLIELALPLETFGALPAGLLRGSVSSL